jgi:hypothetical protein
MAICGSRVQPQPSDKLPQWSRPEFSGLSGTDPPGITAGPEAMSSSEFNFSGNRIGRITPAGVVTEFIAGISPARVPQVTAGGW